MNCCEWKKSCFTNLCNELKSKIYLHDSRDSMLEENGAMFL